VWEFKQNELGGNFIKTLWNLLLRDDDMSTILMRFIWALPLKFKRKFIAAIDAHLSDRYPMFKGLSQNWPGQNFIPPYVRPAEERKNDFDLVTRLSGLSASTREVTCSSGSKCCATRCDDRPCEVGV
jgi:glutamate synthase (NADPH/NADH) small chain